VATEVGTAYVTIIPSARGFAKKLQGELAGELRQAIGTVPDEQGEKAGQSFGNKFSRGASSALSGIGGLLKTVLAAGAIGIGAGLAAITAFGLKSAATLEQTRISFNSLTGSVEEGGKVFDQLQKFAAATPFEFTDLTQTSARFLAFAGAAGLAKDQLIPFLTTVGNVASVTGAGAQGLNSVSLAMGQIASSGKLTLDNLNQISEALPGFSGVAAIAAARGETTAQVMKEISAGSISGADGIKALLQGMQQFPGAAGAMEAQSQTLLGVFSTFKDTISQALTNAFQPIIPGLKDSITQITPILGQAVGALAPAIGGVLTSVLPLVSTLVSALTPILTPLLQGLEPALGSLGSALGPLGGALGQIATAIAPLLPILGGLIGSLSVALVPIISSLTPLFDSLVGVISDLAAVLGPVLEQLGGKIGALLAPAVDFLVQSLDVLGPALLQLLPPLLALAGPAIDALITALPQLLNAFLPLLPAIVDLVPPLADLLVALLPLAQIGANSFAAIVPVVAKILTFLSQISALTILHTLIPLVKGITDGINLFVKGLQNAPETLHKIADFFSSIGSFFSGAGSSIGSFFSNLGSTIVGALKSAFDATVGFFAALPGRIIDTLVALPGQLLGLLRQLTDGILFSIGFLIGSVIGELLALPGQTRAIFSALWTEAVALFTGGVDAVVSFVTQLPGRVVALFVSLRDRATAETTSLWSSVKSAVSAGIDAVVSFVSSLPGRVSSFVSDTWARARQLFSDGIAALVQLTRELPGRAADALSGLKDKLVGAASTAIDAFKRIGADIMAGMVDGITGAIDSVVDAVKHAVGKVIDGAKSALHINSPSKVFAEIGEFTMQGYAQGVTESAGLAQNAVAAALAPPGALLGAVSQANLSVQPAASAARGGDTFNFAGREAFTIVELEAAQARRDALDRIGRKP
jgi:tape measure domain-containing protein